MPSELCSDEQFIRRVYSRHHRHAADARARCKAFLADKDAAKRDKLVDRLLETPEYSYYFANKWADVLRVKRRQPAATGPSAPSPSTTGFARASPPTSRTTSSPAKSWPPSATRRKSPPTVWYKDLHEAGAVRR